MSGTNILGIIGIAVVIYLIGSLRVLRQYERGVVFLLGKFEGVRGPGLTLIFVPTRILAYRHDANPLAKNHHEG
jgi:regulator of protease activity HflC (stomatin/prohibitin superfamily)